MNSSEIRERYLNFFKERGHIDIGSASLRPENDPTTLFTGSGMQPLLPYLLGEKHPAGARLVNSQKCFRAEDIEEVGDNRHTTFFEMLGNWSLGDYFKEEQLGWLFEFLTKEINIPKEKLWVTCFEGDRVLGIPKDTESAEIWNRLGIPEERIRFYDSKKNWWSRAGTPENMPAGEPGGPDSEVFYDFGTEHNTKFGEHCHPNCDCGRFMEIGNSVFMEYVKQKDGSFAPLPQKNVDFGGGLERITAAANDNPDVFAIDLFSRIIDQIESASSLAYSDSENKRAFRIIADHIRGAVFMIADGVVPSNTDAGYVLRRIIRRAVQYADKLNIKHGHLAGMSTIICEEYKDSYKNLHKEMTHITLTIGAEEGRFRETLKKGLSILDREFPKAKDLKKGETYGVPPDLSPIKINGKFERSYVPTALDGKWFFDFYQSFGFPLELAVEELEKKGKRFMPYEKDELRSEFNQEMKKHQKLSRIGAEKKFKGGLADHGEKTTMLHTATHLLLAGLRKELGEDVHQAGSNITAERARFDFTHPQKVERNALDKVEQYVNDAIAAGAERMVEEIPREEAKNSGVEGSFWERYPDTVKVFTFRDKKGVIWSRELCGGPHVENTKDIKGRFKIIKEEAVAAGVRRIKAVLG